MRRDDRRKAPQGELNDEQLRRHQTKQDAREQQVQPSSALGAIHTIGYGSRDRETLVTALEQHGVRFVIDIRSAPYSRFKPEYCRDPLAAFLGCHGIRYVFMGDTLGGRPEDPSCYVDGHVDYDRCRRAAWFHAGLHRLRTAAAKKIPVAIFCSEQQPERCHRSKLIAPALLELGIEVRHIDANGEVLTQQEVMRRLTGGQRLLFGDPHEAFRSRKRYRPAEKDDEPLQ